MFKHSIPATAASFSIGAASADMAKTMANDLVMPLLFLIASAVYKPPVAPKFRFGAFGNSVVVWVCVLGTSYLLMEYVFARGVIGVSTTVLNRDEERTMMKAREEAAKPIKQAKHAVLKAVDNITGPAVPPLGERDQPVVSTIVHTTGAPASFDGGIGCTHTVST